MGSYVIVGNGVAAIGCIEGIRSVDERGAITVVSRERHPAYCRPLISYLLEGKTDLAHMPYRDAGFYERMGCTTLVGREATRIDAEARAVELDDGTRVAYDALCLATGSSPFVPSFPGLDTVTSKHAFMTLDDALGLERAIDATSRVLIVGAGLIGLKCAEGICGRVLSITVCDLADRVLSSILDAECAALMQARLEGRGIRLMLGDTVERFEGDRAHMRGGEVVAFDVLVLAVGVRANTALVGQAGGEVDRGVIVDDRMRTSLPDVFAAGDCAQGYDVSLGDKRVLAILPNAYLQGHAAGVNMAGGDERHDKGVPMNSIGFFGLHAMTAGTYAGEVYEERLEGSIRRLFVKDGLLRGFILIGGDERAGIYTSLVRERIPLDSFDFDALRRGATTAAFPAGRRRQMFGEAV
ncbi:MAG: NAD(P)/FAD-dependent oxidoreductase [Atopobiaceae bacterium]|nr:NAD(P)/FAD-dependent oxidoreductase [Atopobiaceae bacterium]